MRIRLPDGTGDMNLKYLVRDTDRHGKTRIYVRVKGRSKVALKAPEGTPEFLAEYNAAIAGKITPKDIKRGPDPIVTNSLRWLCTQYMAKAPDFLAGKPITRQRKRMNLDWLCELTMDGARIKCGSIMIQDLRAKHIQAIIDTKVATPFAANNLRKTLKRMFRWAFKKELVAIDPTVGTEGLKTPKGGHLPWGAAEIKKFIERHPINTQAGLTLAIYYFLGARISDAVKLGRQNETAGGTAIKWRETKGGETKVTEVPIVPEFRAILDMHKTNDRMLYLMTQYGAGFTANGFGNKVRRWCDQAGLTDFSSHGVRKGSATAAADGGASDNDLLGMFGWSSRKEATTYTQRADRARGAARAGNLISLNRIISPK